MSRFNHVPKKRVRPPTPAKARCGDSRNGTRPTSTVIWPLARRRAAHVVKLLQVKFGEASTSQTDFVSDATDAKVLAEVAKHAFVLPPDLQFKSTDETLS